tara:strand:- start:25 stop:249 length:225 start_codon:yes stop_codon:yes gene_type:complete
MDECNIIGVFHNISKTCTNDIEFARDQCQLFCMISIMNGIEMCSKELYNVGLLEQLKELIKWCVYKKYEDINPH